MLLSLENKESNPLGSSTTTIPLPVMSSTESLRANGLERNTSIWYLLKHNWRQLTSLIPGLILLCALGNLHNSWSIWKIYMYFYYYQNVEMDVLLGHFIGAAIGSFFAGWLNSSCSKILIYYALSVALVPVSVIFVLNRTLPYLLLIGRVLAGFLYGVTLITLILHIADNSSQFMRRHFMWAITVINLLPTIQLAEFISTVTGEGIASSIGVLMFALAIFTLIFMPCTYESIVFLLANRNDLRALEIMLKLRKESRHYIRHDFNEFKMMLAEDHNDGEKIFSRPLFLVLLLRLLNVLLTNSSIYWLFLSNIWFDYQYWMCSTTISTKPFLNLFKNCTDYNTTENLILDERNFVVVKDNDTLLANSINKTLSSDNNGIFNLTELNRTCNSATWFGNKSIISMANNSSILNHSFILSDHSNNLPFQITQFILIVTISKIVFGVPFLCLAEKCQIYRNRIIFKVTFCFGVINLVFFIGTLVCSYADDSLLFTFYISKLLSVIYGFYLLVAFSIDTVGNGELAETFSLSKRYKTIPFIEICEHFGHAIAILLVMNALFRFYFHVVQSAIVCFICYLLLKWMPNECLHISLRAARDKHFMKMATANN